MRSGTEPTRLGPNGRRRGCGSAAPGMRGYSQYSPHLDEIRQYGDGGPGTDYEIVVSWWRLSYTSATTVTVTEPSERVDWRTTQGLKARGYWDTEPLPDKRAPPGHDHATPVRLRIQFDPDTLGSVPLVVEESERIVAGMVADLEGEHRDVAIEVHRGPESV